VATELRAVEEHTLISVYADELAAFKAHGCRVDRYRLGGRVGYL